MLNIVIPMAGRGSRFAQAGFLNPKPLIDVNGRPMIAWVVENVRPACAHRFIFICQKEHLEKYALADTLQALAPGCGIISIDHVTEGAACTVLLAERWIDNDDSLMIANSDQYVDAGIEPYLAALGENDGLIMTMPSRDPNCSYVRTDAAGEVTLVREKERISEEATVGIYNFRHGADFVSAAGSMIRRNIRTNGEFYVAPVYNELTEKGKRIVVHNVGPRVYSLGTPSDLDFFLAQPVSQRSF